MNGHASSQTPNTRRHLLCTIFMDVLLFNDNFMKNSSVCRFLINGIGYFQWPNSWPIESLLVGEEGEGGVVVTYSRLDNFSGSYFAWNYYSEYVMRRLAVCDARKKHKASSPSVIDVTDRFTCRNLWKLSKKSHQNFRENLFFSQK